MPTEAVKRLRPKINLSRKQISTQPRKNAKMIPMKPIEPPGTFGERLRSIRKQRNFSQGELGELAGLHYTNISRYERGTSQPNADALKRLAEALGVSGDYLMEGAVDDAARARFEDMELLHQFQEVEKLSSEDKQVIKTFLDAFLFKRRVQTMASS